MESGWSLLDSNVRHGARRMLQAALESAVDAFLEEHAALLDECGRRCVVRHGYLPVPRDRDRIGVMGWSNLDVPKELVVYPGAGHGFCKQNHRRAKMEWDLAWFEGHLFGKSNRPPATPPAK